MNILFICDEYPPGKNGGIGSITKMLAEKLHEQGHGVYVVGLYPHGFGGDDTEDQNNIKIWRLRYRTDVGLISGDNTLKDKVLVHSLRKSGIMNLDATQQLKKMMGFIAELIRTYKIDVIEMPDWNNFYFNVSLTNLTIPRFKVPLIVKMHGTLSYFNSEQDLPVSEKMFLKERYVFKRADAVCGVSKYTTSYCKRLYKLDKDPRVLYNGIEAKPYKGSQSRLNANHVVFSGSLFHKKGIFSLVKAWKKVISKLPGANLHVYGKGNTEMLIALLDDETRPFVKFYGHVSRQHLMKELEIADLAVFPSYSETFGLGVVEAMSVGCPVIYTKRSCGPEIVEHNKEGILVDPDSPEEISESIVSLLSDPALRSQMSLAAYKKASTQFNINAIAEQHIAYYKEVIEAYDFAKPL